MKGVNNNLSRKIAFTIIVSILIIGNLLMYIFLNIINDRTESTNLKDIKLTSQLLSDNIKSLIESKIAFVNLLSQNSFIDKVLINRNLTIDDNFVWVGVTDGQGLIKYSSNNQLVGSNFSNTSFFTSGKRTISSIDSYEFNNQDVSYIKQVTTISPIKILSVSMPLSMNSNLFNGELTVFIDLTFLNNAISHEGFTYNIINQAKQSIIDANFIPPANKISNVDNYSYIDNDKYIAFSNIVSTRYSLPKWSVTLSQSNKIDGLLTYEINTIWWLIFCILFILSIVWIISGYISYPYMLLNDTAKKIINNINSQSISKLQTNNDNKHIIDIFNKYIKKSTQSESIVEELKLHKKKQCALTKSLIELQDINKHMIGRELQMAKLKKENEELKSKIK